MLAFSLCIVLINNIGRQMLDLAMHYQVMLAQLTDQTNVP
ncbi:hypothetical protein PS943_02824 [Pseudomonas fluorescens]|uniref:Uncharacterized protein n=1 Tax=Pseudomonas fluorescens TaxID=294 RepID=A0A5E7WBL5_PSEFL|nr:hypothetical protein PS943_02824 [Pseudomonas fluorescens]